MTIEHNVKTNFNSFIHSTQFILKHRRYQYNSLELCALKYTNFIWKSVIEMENLFTKMVEW